MSEQVHASPEDIRRLAISLTTFKQEVAAASRKAQGALGRANWHDNRKDQFEATFRDLQKKIDRYMSGDVDEMVKSLNQLASKLEAIRNVRM